MIRCYVFDIDGTLADCSHRIHLINSEKKDWRAFFATVSDDKPIEHMIELAKRLWATAPLVFVSGRSDECQNDTSLWLEQQGFGFVKQSKPRYLYMRRAGDHRPDHLIKSEILDELLRDGFQPIMAFDDRNQVVKMWRERGIPCAQVAEGDF